MKSIIFNILKKIKGNKLIVYIIDYIKIQHPNLWNKIKQKVIIYSLEEEKSLKLNDINDYEKDFMNRVLLKIDGYNKLREKMK